MRSQVSLELDGELSQLERAMLAAHLLRCGECRAFRLQASAFTRLLRAAALEWPATRFAVRRPRRTALALRFQSVAAAAMAFAVVGVATQVAARGPGERHVGSSSVVHFQSQDELQRELAIIAAPAGATGSQEAIAR
ncbi:MAG: zf-HC2 domain-containing protein [Gaiellaceae bacterium]